MRNARVLMIAGMTLVTGAAAHAADIPAYQPPPAQPICVPRAQAHLWPGVPICAEEFSSWYLRGDIGMTNQKVKKLENVLLPANANHVSSDFDSSMLFGLGFGYQFNNWMRADVTGEYRGKADYAGLDIIRDGDGRFTDEYRAKKAEWLFLLNGYADLGTWWCVTPFVGAGLGFSRVTISDFTDINTPRNGVAFADTASQWNFAWALHAGLAFQASKSLAIEFAYRYASMGDGITGDTITYLGTNNVNNPTTFKDITSHDFKLGVRFTCCDTEPVALPPIMRKG